MANAFNYQNSFDDDLANEFRQILSLEPNFSPADIADLYSWYDAADSASIIHSSGNASQWSDKSGNEYHALQADVNRQPSYNSGGKYLDFNGQNNGDGFSTSAPTPEEITIFMVTMRNAQSLGSGSALRPLIHFGDKDRLALGTPFDLITGRENLGTSQSDGGEDVVAFWAGATSGNVQKMEPYVDLINGENTLITTTYEHLSGDNFSISHQRNLDAPVFASPLPMDWTIRGQLHLGFDPGHDAFASGDRHYAGRFYEIISYNRVLSVGETEQIQEYLINKWAISL